MARDKIVHPITWVWCDRPGSFYIPLLFCCKLNSDIFEQSTPVSRKVESMSGILTIRTVRLAAGYSGSLDLIQMNIDVIFYDVFLRQRKVWLLWSHRKKQCIVGRQRTGNYSRLSSEFHFVDLRYVYQIAHRRGRLWRYDIILVFIFMNTFIQTFTCMFQVGSVLFTFVCYCNVILHTRLRNETYWRRTHRLEVGEVAWYRENNSPS